MDEEKGFTEWQVNDTLPNAFVNWLKETITEKAMKERKGFMQIASELNVDAALLSRWLAWDRLHENRFKPLPVNSVLEYILC